MFRATFATLFLPLMSVAPVVAQKPRVLGSTPVPTPAQLKEERRFVAGVVDPQNTLDMVVGRPRIILLKKIPTRTLVADTNTVELTLLQPKGTQMIVQGNRVGITVLNLWFPDPENKEKEKIISYLVRVFPDPEAKARRAAAYAALAKEVNAAFPNSRVRLTPVGGSVILSGQAHDPVEAAKIIRVVK